MPYRPSGRHLSLVDRGKIENCLKEGRSIRYAANILHCSPSTVSREIQSHAKTLSPKNCMDCTFYKSCTLRHVCNPSSLNRCNKPCKRCSRARKCCAEYARAYCDIQLDNSTGVCNSCNFRRNCHFEHRIYDAEQAQKEADAALHNSRKGFDITEEHMKRISETVTPLIRKGQSPYHIMQEHGADLGISESTLRRLIDAGALDARRIDLRDAVRRKLRRKKSAGSYKTMKVIKDGHKYEDYLQYIKEHDVAVVEMDCIEGLKEDKATLLTLHFVEPHLQIAIIMNEQTSSEVVEALDKIEISLGADLFTECFPLILTDNGHEFADIDGMERSCITGGKRTTIFFCEPNRSDEKGACENNHKYIRYVIPKGTSLEPLKQADISLMMNHVNSFARKSLRGKTPYQIGKVMLPEDFFILLGLTEVAPDDVNLTPALLKKPVFSE